MVRSLSCLLLASSLLAGCLPNNTTPNSDDCGTKKTVVLDTIIHPGIVNGKEEVFLFETPEARNDCHAIYQFYFFWADRNRRESDSTMPPLENLEHAFGPGGEFSYFPSPAPTKARADDPDGDPGDYMWRWSIIFSAGNKNSSLPTTRYFVGTALDNTTAKPGDSTRIQCAIDYFDEPKKE